ncbi:MAG: hypothetical protein ACRDKW_12205 [Actinomycetota bacterium]
MVPGVPIDRGIRGVHRKVLGCPGQEVDRPEPVGVVQQVSVAEADHEVDPGGYEPGQRHGSGRGAVVAPEAIDDGALRVHRALHEEEPSDPQEEGDRHTVEGLDPHGSAGAPVGAEEAGAEVRQPGDATGAEVGGLAGDHEVRQPAPGRAAAAEHLLGVRADLPEVVRRAEEALATDEGPGSEREELDGDTEPPAREVRGRLEDVAVGAPHLETAIEVEPAVDRLGRYVPRINRVDSDLVDLDAIRGP